jgi:hypothetical protein
MTIENGNFGRTPDLAHARCGIFFLSVWITFISYFDESDFFFALGGILFLVNRLKMLIPVFLLFVP